MISWSTHLFIHCNERLIRFMIRIRSDVISFAQVTFLTKHLIFAFSFYVHDYFRDDVLPTTFVRWIKMWMFIAIETISRGIFKRSRLIDKSLDVINMLCLSLTIKIMLFTCFIVQYYLIKHPDIRNYVKILIKSFQHCL